MILTLSQHSTCDDILYIVYFRCEQGFGGLRDQGAINQVVYKFVCHYNSLFRDESEDPPELQWVRSDCVIRKQ